VHEVSPGEGYLLGAFLLGGTRKSWRHAHLFGDTHSVNIELDSKGGWRLCSRCAARLERIPAYVHIEPEELGGPTAKKCWTRAPADQRKLFESE